MYRSETLSSRSTIVLQAFSFKIFRHLINLLAHEQKDIHGQHSISNYIYNIGIL